jgi:hypothetical protein
MTSGGIATRAVRRTHVLPELRYLDAAPGVWNQCNPSDDQVGTSAGATATLRSSTEQKRYRVASSGNALRAILAARSHHSIQQERHNAESHTR